MPANSIVAPEVDTLKMFGEETCTTGEPISKLVIRRLKIMNNVRVNIRRNCLPDIKIYNNSD